MIKNKLTVSHAPFWHDGDSIFTMNCNIILAALPAAVFGIIQFGLPAFAVLALAMSTAMLWELLFNKISKQPVSIGDMNAAVIGLLFGMMLPVTTPWWVIVTGTFVAVIIGKMIFGGSGANPFNPVVIGMAILMLSWNQYFDMDTALVNYTFDFARLVMAPLAALKYLGVDVINMYPVMDLFMGKQVGAIGTSFGLGLVIGGIFLILRGYIRWEISLAFIAGVVIPALIFNLASPDKFAGPLFHLFSGYTLFGAFFLATDHSSSPVNTIPMIIYGLLGGVMIILMRNIGAYADGTILAILLINIVNPLIDNIRPKALGKKGVSHA